MISEEIAHKLKLRVKCVPNLFQILCQWKINYYQNELTLQFHRIPFQRELILAMLGLLKF